MTLGLSITKNVDYLAFCDETLGFNHVYPKIKCEFQEYTHYQKVS